MRNSKKEYVGNAPPMRALPLSFVPEEFEIELHVPSILKGDNYEYVSEQILTQHIQTLRVELRRGSLVKRVNTLFETNWNPKELSNMVSLFQQTTIYIVNHLLSPFKTFRTS